MKSRQFCSVCKQWLEMEVVPTADDDDDDGVIWFRCPQCQGFLPKLSGGASETGTVAPAAPAAGGATADTATTDSLPSDSAKSDGAKSDGAKSGTAEPPAVDPDDFTWDSPAEMMAARGGGRAATAPRDDADDLDEDDAPDDDDADDADAGPAERGGAAASAAEPLAAYAAMLAAADAGAAVPYRPWEVYEVGQCILHLAWDDCGVVVAKESLPGGRRVIKCYFAAAGVVRLIEDATR